MKKVLPWAICRNVLEDFCCINFGGFSRGFSRRIFLGTFSRKNEEKKSGEKIREKIRRLKNKNPRKIRSAESRPMKEVQSGKLAFSQRSRATFWGPKLVILFWHNKTETFESLGRKI